MQNLVGAIEDISSKANPLISVSDAESLRKFKILRSLTDTKSVRQALAIGTPHTSYKIGVLSARKETRAGEVIRFFQANPSSEEAHCFEFVLHSDRVLVRRYLARFDVTRGARPILQFEIDEELQANFSFEEIDTQEKLLAGIVGAFSGRH